MNYTIKDIARRANVSIATVSRVINKTGSVAQKTEKRILAITRELNYVPNNVARSLVKQSSKTIGVIVADIMNPFYAEIIRAIQDQADEDGYSVISCNSDEDMGKEKQCIHMLLENQVNGIIFAGGRGKGDYYNQQVVDVAKIVPVVLADEALEGDNIYSIICNKSKGAYEAVHYLIELGHRNIAMINGYQEYKPSIEKLKGYKKALKEAGIPYCDKYIKNSDYHLDGGMNHVKELMNLEDPPSAIFAANDLMAMGAIKALKDLGYKVPKDISVIGFDDIAMNEYTMPALSSVRQEMTLQGHMAVQILHKLFSNEENPKKKYTIEPSLIKRDSCQVKQ
ncbi:MAG: LacI family DNA-binding transcriptional regulator [Hungatella sp.]